MHKVSLTTPLGSEKIVLLPNRSVVEEYIQKLVLVMPKNRALYVNVPTLNIYGWLHGKADVSGN